MQTFIWDFDRDLVADAVVVPCAYVGGRFGAASLD